MFYMQKLHFSTSINAPAKKVWQTMLDDATYRKWTTVFSPGSYFEGSWEKGSRIKFIGPDQQGNLGGITSMIAENRPYEFVSIKHLGVIENGVEDTSSEKVAGWAGAMENYTFKEANGVTEVQIDIDVDDPFVDEFKQMWPKALESLKKLAESS